MATESGPASDMLTSAHHIPYWDRDTDQDMVCVDVRSETHDVKTFTFRSREDRYFSFMAGQYFSFDFDIEGSNLKRCYSVSTSSLMPHPISVTVKRVEGGTVSNWLHEKLKPGTVVRAMGPSGKFKLDGGPGDKYLFITGGSGITPVMSMVRTLADARKYPDILFFHASRTSKDVIFEDELRWRAKTTPNFRLFLLPERADDAEHAGITGRVNEALLSMAVPDLAERRIMCCGPAPFMKAVRALGAQLGVPADQYFEEDFGGTTDNPELRAPLTATPISGAPDPTKNTGETYQLHLSKQDKTIPVCGNENLLSAMRQAGLHIPSSCGEGECGTCKTKLISGKIHMEHNGGIRKREIDAGYFLPCCSTALEDLVIER